MSCARQVENLSPTLFSQFLNDQVQFMSNSYNVLSTLSKDIRSVMNNDDTEVFFQLYLPLYADYIVVFAESLDELQVALGIMKSYCDTWNLQVNIYKTEVVLTKERNRRKPVFQCNAEILEIVDDFSYLCIKFNYNGTF